MDEDNDPLSAALSSRRIPPGRSRNKQGGSRGRGKGKGGNDAVFDPLRTLGRYEVQLGSSGKRARQQTRDGATPTSWLEIHELTEAEHGLLGTLHISGREGGVSGMCVLAGSRKGLQEIVDRLEQTGEGCDGEGEDEGSDHVDEEEVEEDDGEDDGDDTEKTEMERSDERLNRRFRAFEKNSFRNPKFWVRWKGHVQPTIVPESQSLDTREENSTQTATESNLGYVVFASNDCDKFEGTVNCPALGWDNLKMHARKSRAKATPCSVNWADF